MARTVSQTINLQTPSESLDKYITRIDENGITVHPENENQPNHIEINAQGIDLKQGSRVIAHYGNSIILGDLLSFLQLDSQALEFFLNNKSMGRFGYSDIFKSYGVNAENVMIKGAGNALRLDNNINGTYQGQFILETRSNGHLSLKPGLKRTEEEEEE